jgi:hypothetical protein
MNKLLQWGVACGFLAMLQAPGPSRGQAPGTAGAPGMDTPAPIPVQGPIVPGTAQALVVELRSSLVGGTNAGPVSAGIAGAPGIGTRTGGAASARGPMGPYVADGPSFGPFAAGYYTSTPVNPDTFGFPESASNAFEAPGGFTSADVIVPTITYNGGETTMTLGRIAILGPPPLGPAINTGFGPRAINVGFGTRAINTGFGTQAINSGFGTRSMNLGFGTILSTPYGTQGQPPPGRPPQ